MWKVYHREIRKTSISTSTVVKLTNTENRILPFDLDGIKIILIDDSTFYTVGFSITPINTRLELVVKKPTAFAFGKVYKMKTECVYQVNPMYMHLCVFFLNSMNEKLTIKNFKRNFQNPCNITWLEGGGVKQFTSYEKISLPRSKITWKYQLNVEQVELTKWFWRFL